MDGDVSELFPVLVLPEDKKEEAPVESKDEVEPVEKSEFQVKLEKLHEELAVIAGGRAESDIGSSVDEPYWKKLNEIRQHLHSNKG